MKPVEANGTGKFAEGAQAGQKRRAGATFLPRFKIVAAQKLTTSFNPLCHIVNARWPCRCLTVSELNRVLG